MIVPLRLGHLLCSADRTAIEVHQAPVRCGMRKDHAASAPVAGGMWPGARRRIAHTELLRQGQGNAPLLQVGVATTPRQGSLERGELVGEVGPCWDWRRWRGWMGRAFPGGCHDWPRSRRWRLSTAWHALPAG